MPSVFFGSSTQGLPLARMLRDRLQGPYGYDCKVWDEGVFRLSSYSIPDLLKATLEFDYSIMVWTPDDTRIHADGTQTKTPRDNVVAETFLFMGKNGTPDCTFVVAPDPKEAPDFKYATDFTGLTLAYYSPRLLSENPDKALEYLIERIEGQMAAREYWLPSLRISTKVLDPKEGLSFPLKIHITFMNPKVSESVILTSARLSLNAPIQLHDKSSFLGHLAFPDGETGKDGPSQQLLYPGESVSGWVALKEDCIKHDQLRALLEERAAGLCKFNCLWGGRSRLSRIYAEPI